MRERFYLEKEMSITLLQGSHASTGRPFDNGSMKVKTLQWVRCNGFRQVPRKSNLIKK